MPVNRRMHTDYTYKHATVDSPCVRHANPPIRREFEAAPRYRSSDEVTHHETDPWAASAPKMSDLLHGVGLQDATERNLRLEEIQKRSINYMNAFNRHRERSKRTVGVRAGALAVDAVVGTQLAGQFSQAGQMAALGMQHAAHHAHLVGEAAEIATMAAATGVEGLNEIAHHETSAPRNHQAAKLEQIAEDYPALAARAELSRNASDPFIRHRLGEDGRTQFYKAIRETDEAVPRYLHAVARTAHIADDFRNGIPHMGFMWSREYGTTMQDTGATTLSRQMLASTVREYGYVAHEHNRTFDGQARIVDGGLIRRLSSMDIGRLSEARFARRGQYPNGRRADDDEAHV